MKMKQYIVDAFTDKLFSGNQAAVCILNEWLPDSLMQNIAKENNFSETAFCCVEDAQRTRFLLRWFTPNGEVDFCGHATLGTAFVIFNFYTDATKITFNTQVGDLIISRKGDFLEMDFPAYQLKEIEVSRQMTEAIGTEPIEAYIDRDLMLVLKNSNDVKRLKPNLEKVKNLEGLLLIVTAKSGEYDCVSRVFAPKLGINEDPVTGSAHCMIVPYWCKILGKNELVCYQASERTGVLYARTDKDRVKISGKAVLFSEGEIKLA